MSEIKAKIKNCLINKKIVLSLIEKPTNALYKVIGDSTLLIGASVHIKLPQTQFGELKEVLTDEEREYLESLIKTDLNIYSDKGKEFWNSKLATIILKRTSKDLSDADLILDLSKPYDYIKYKIALVSHRVANSWDERYDNGEYVVVIKDGESEFVDTIKKVNKEEKVLSYLMSIKSSKRKMYNLIRLYGDDKVSTAITMNSSLELMYTTLWEICKSTKGINGLYPLIIIDEKELIMQILVADAITVGMIEKRGWEYRLKGGEKIGSNIDEAINYLNDKNNQHTKIRIEQEIEKYYKEIK
jgi:hypothetical protein